MTQAAARGRTGTRSTAPTSARGFSDGAIAALVAALSLVALVILHLPFLTTYAVKGDDYALLLHSAVHYDPSPVAWLTEGYAGYFVQIPQLEQAPTNFIRPTVNATVFLESLLVGDPHSVWMLTTNYVGHAVVVALTYLVSRRFAGLGPRWALLAAAVFWGSTATSGLFHSIAFRGDMLGALLAVSGLLVMADLVAGGRRGWRLVLVSTLLTAAAFAKEAAVAAPAVAGVWWLAQRAGHDAWRPQQAWRTVRSDLALTAALTLPVLLFASARLAAGLDGNYALDDLPGTVFGVPMAVLNPFRFLATAFIPVDTGVIKQALEGRAAALDLLRAATAIVVNAATWVALLVLARRRDLGRLGPLLVMGLAASAVPIAIKADPRFLYFGQTLLVPLLIGTLVRLHRTRLITRSAATAAAVVLLAVSPLALVVTTLTWQSAAVAANAEAAALRDTVSERLSDPQLRRLYLVNAADHGVASLEVMARDADRDDVDLRVVTTMSGPAGAGTGGTAVHQQPDGLRIETHYGPGQRPFGYVTPRGLEQLAASTDIRYGPITEVRPNAWGKLLVTQSRLVVTLPVTPGDDDYAVVGFDPREPGVHLHTPDRPGWQRASTHEE